YAILLYTTPAPTPLYTLSLHDALPIYPTRSGTPAEELLGKDWLGTLVHDGWSVYDRFARAAHQQCLGHLQRRCQRLLETAVGGADRKSTRLNSSHDQISYAVFCLKKKK